ncbi:MAG: cation:proton antiporter [Ignavibacteriales bacterium]|nr:cation:proton antiporter [Ignavibacteriales bacterium]
MKDFFENISHYFELPLSNPVLIFAFILFVILIAPIFLRRTNIPGIIGLIISGVIIGPFGLNIIENNSAIELFSTIGILYIMFIAGLDLDLVEFRQNKNKSLLFGFATFFIPLTIGFPICYYILEYDFNASLLIASMFSTHTLVAYPIVSRLGVTKNQAVAITVGGTIITDTAVLLLLAIIIGSHSGTLSQEFWIRLSILLVILSFLMFVIIPRITKWFFQKFASEKHSHYIFVLAVLFFAAFFSEVAGLEPIIGAFIAGIALNPLIPHSSALMNRIEFIGNSLFIPFFLISVGMLLDLSVIFQGTTALVVAITLTIVALFGKWFAAFIIQIIFKYSSVQRQLIFGLSSSHAAAILAVIIVGFNANILDENILNGTIVLIMITCVVASFVTERAAKKIVIEAEPEAKELTASSIINNEHILLPIANMVNIDKLLEFTIYIKNRKSTNPISVLTVVPNNEEAEKNIAIAKAKLVSFVKQASATETKLEVIATIDHNAASGIARTSREIMADIIVLGWPQRPGVIDKFIGEKIESILLNTEKTTMICCLNKPLVSLKRILVVSPPLSELENGFKFLFTKITKLAKELSLPIIYYCNENTKVAFKKQIQKHRSKVNITFNTIDIWDDFRLLTQEVKQEVLFILISARKGSISHLNMLDNLPSKLEKQLKDNCKIIIYPQQKSQPHILE